MARATLRTRKAAIRGKSRKTSRSPRGKAGKGSAAKPIPKSLAKAKPGRARATKVLPKDVQPMQPKGIPVRETVIVDVSEEQVPGVITITEFEETDVREKTVDRVQPRKGRGTSRRSCPCRKLKREHIGGLVRPKVAVCTENLMRVDEVRESPRLRR